MELKKNNFKDSPKRLLLAITLICLFYFGAIYSSLRWGTGDIQGILLYPLVTILSGILISTRFMFIITILEAATVIFITFLEIHGVNGIHYSWHYKGVDIDDIFFNILTFGIFSLLFLFYNTNLRKALHRAHLSEIELKRERDQLEITVETRTRQLREMEMEKMTQVYRFAEIGRTTAGLFHDLVNPLNLISLNLDQLQKHSKTMQKNKFSRIKVSIRRAVLGTRRLGNFIQSMRQQLQDRDVNKQFSLIKETKMALQMLQFKAKSHNIKVLFHYTHEVEIEGNPIKFNQIILNLISNAVDSLIDTNCLKKEIHVVITTVENTILITIEDNGKGIPDENKEKIFEPFFSTKDYKKSSGIGLYICKKIIEKNFHGFIKVKNGVHGGAYFSICIPKN